MAYQAIPPVSAGGGSSDVTSALYNFAVSQYPTINRQRDTDIVSTAAPAAVDYATQTLAPNVGSSTPTTAAKGGVTQLSTNAAGAGGIVIFRIGATGSPISTNAKTDVPWFCASIQTFPTTVDANTQAALNFETLTFSAAVGFGIFGPASTGFYSIVAGATQSVGTVAVDLSGAYVLLMLGFDGTTVKGWVSTPAGILTTTPTLAATMTDLTNVPTSASSAMFTLHENATVAAKTNRVDYIYEAWLGAV